MAPPEDAEAFRTRTRPCRYSKYKRRRVRSIMSSVPPAWEEYDRLIPSEVSPSFAEDFQSTHYLSRDVDALFVALDANFRLRRRAVSNNEQDPSLSKGWGYFVEDAAFKAYLTDHNNDVQEVCSHISDAPILTSIQKSTCSNHNAVNMADVKSKKGCDATGVGMVVCARHGMRLPNGIADLQYGERCIFLSTYFNGVCLFMSIN